jgi:phage tail-like protein
MSNRTEESKYLRYLPSIYQVEENSAFLGQFLKALEKILSGIDDGVEVNIDGQHVKGIEEILDDIHDVFDPNATDFLPWLAGWVALSLKEGESWSDNKKRELITKIVPLYQKRGTKEGLEEYLKIYVGEGVQIIDELGPFQIGVSSRVGMDTVIEGLSLYHFIVEVTLSTAYPQRISEIENSIREIIDVEKPAHTSYGINLKIPTMKVGSAIVGMNTLLWR